MSNFQIDIQKILPFLWMVFNSMKVQDEMATEKFKLLPKEPNVVMQTPYFAIDEFETVDLPEGIPGRYPGMNPLRF